MSDQNKDADGFLETFGSGTSVGSSNRDRDGAESNTSKKRNSEKEDSNETEQATESDPVETADKANSDDSEDPITDRKSVLMYLPDDVRQELDIRFDELNAKHKREHGEALEKNRDYYPAVIQAGLTDESLKDILNL